MLIALTLVFVLLAYAGVAYFAAIKAAQAWDDLHELHGNQEEPTHSS